MQLTCTRITLPRLNVIARFAIRAVRRVAGEKARIIARNSVKPTARLSVLKEDALDQSLENVVI